MPQRACIKRIAIGAGAVLVALIVSVIVWAEVGSRLTSAELDKRMRYWNAAVASGVRVGDSREQAEGWFKRTFPAEAAGPGFYDSYDQSLSAIAETIEVRGLKLPCDAWMVRIEIELGADGRVRSRRARTIGACV